MQTLKANELKTGDVVQVFNDAFGTASTLGRGLPVSNLNQRESDNGE
jgi:hypothetical protein